VEYEDAAKRMAREVGLARADIDDILDHICAVAHRRRIHFLWRPFLKDPLPASLHKSVRELAKREDVSINQLITTALAEKLSALMTVEYLDERSKRGNRRKFERAMAKVKEGKPTDS
jgi:hypothetical protein